MEICTPAVVYLVLAVLSIIILIVKKASFIALFFKIIIIALWTWLLNYLCSIGYKSFSWFLVLLPFIITIIFITIGIVAIVDAAV
jgi:hypothetical protein